MPRTCRCAVGASPGPVNRPVSCHVSAPAPAPAYPSPQPVLSLRARTRYLPTSTASPPVEPILSLSPWPRSDTSAPSKRPLAICRLRALLPLSQTNLATSRPCDLAALALCPSISGQFHVDAPSRSLCYILLHTTELNLVSSPLSAFHEPGPDQTASYVGRETGRRSCSKPTPASSLLKTSVLDLVGHTPLRPAALSTAHRRYIAVKEQ